MVKDIFGELQMKKLFTVYNYIGQSKEQHYQGTFNTIFDSSPPKYEEDIEELEALCVEHCIQYLELESAAATITNWIVM